MKIVQRVWRALVASTIAVMVGSVGMGVVMRYVFNSPLFWADELARYALVWMTFLGSIELFLERDGHLKVTYFLSLATPKVRRWLRAFADIVVLCLMLVVGVGGVIWIAYSSKAVSAAMGMPMSFVYAALPLCGFASAALIIWRFPRSLREAEESDWK